jgi:integrase
MEIITIVKAAELYLENKKYNLSEATLINRAYHFKKYIVSFWGADKTIDAITAESIILWRSWVPTVKMRTDLTKTLSACSMNKVRDTMKDFLRFLFTADFLSENYSELLLRYKSETSDKREFAVWDLNEFNRFCKLIFNINDRLFFSLLYWTGIRIGELIALKWVDFYDGKIQVYKSVSESTTERIGTCRAKIKVTKNAYSVREILLPQTLVNQLEYVKDILICFKAYDENNFIFGQSQPITRAVISNSMKRYCKRSGVRKIRAHNLRHSHASFLINQGVDILTISRRLGHAKIKTTIDTYIHLFETPSPVLDKILTEH